MIIPVGYLQANFRFTGGAVPNGAEVTQAFFMQELAPADPDAAAEFLADEWAPEIQQHMSVNLTFTECYVKFGPNDTGGSGSAARAVPGTTAGESVPPNTCVLIRKQTALGGRRGRGRIYLPGVADVWITSNGTLAGGVINTLQSAFDNFFTGCDAGGLTPVVLHATGISSTPEPTIMGGYSVQPLAATQRDRLRP